MTMMAQDGILLEEADAVVVAATALRSISKSVRDQTCSFQPAKIIRI